MTRAVLARVIGANKVRRRPFKAGARAATARSQAPGSPQPWRYAAGLGAVATAARRRRSQTGPADRPRSQAPTQPGKIAGQNSRAIKAKQDSTAWVLPCINCAWAQSVVGYSLLQGGADG